MSLERDAERLTREIDEQEAPPTAGQAAMAGCLGIALIIKAIFILAITVVMMWLLWACAGACGEAADAAPRLAAGAGQAASSPAATLGEDARSPACCAGRQSVHGGEEAGDAGVLSRRAARADRNEGLPRAVAPWAKA